MKWIMKLNQILSLCLRNTFLYFFGTPYVDEYIMWFAGRGVRIKKRGWIYKGRFYPKEG